MLCCSSECGSISIVQLRTIYCNTHVYTFHVCLCLLALTFLCNSTYLLKWSFQIYQKSIVVFIRSSKVYDSKQHHALKALSHGAIFLATCHAILLLSSRGGSSRFSDPCINRKFDVTIGTVSAGGASI